MIHIGLFCESQKKSPLFLPVLKLLEQSLSRRHRRRQQLHRAGTRLPNGGGGGGGWGCRGGSPLVAHAAAGLPVLLLEEIPSGQFA